MSSFLNGLFVKRASLVIQNFGNTSSMAVENWEHFFKPEVRNSGLAFVSKGQVALLRPSDTEAQAYIRASSSFKVMFQSPSIDSPTITASCSCPPFKKGQFCKHMWAALVVIQEKNPDFFSYKTDLQIKAPEAALGSKQIDEKSDDSRGEHRKMSQAQVDSQAAYKLKQAAYRKQQYQLQKERAQKFKKTRSSKKQTTSEVPPDVEAALHYFSENGFDLKEALETESIGLARKKLARVFHPDHGGSHEEITQLNHFTNILLEFARF